MEGTITGKLEAWPDLEKSLPDKDRGLLVGNGASIALWPKFKYTSLYESGGLSQPPGSLRLLETRAFDGSSLLLARYAVER